MSADQYQGALDAIARLEAAQRDQARPVREPAPMTREQVARVQGKALLDQIEAARGTSVTIPAVGGPR